MVDTDEQVAEAEPVGRTRRRASVGHHQHRYPGRLQHMEAGGTEGELRPLPDTADPDHEQVDAFVLGGGEEDIDRIAVAHLDAVGARQSRQRRAPRPFDESAQGPAPGPSRRVGIVPAIQQPKRVHRHDLGAERLTQPDGPPEGLLRGCGSIDAHHDPSSFHATSVAAAARDARVEGPTPCGSALRGGGSGDRRPPEPLGFSRARSAPSSRVASPPPRRRGPGSRGCRPCSSP